MAKKEKFVFAVFFLVLLSANAAADESVFYSGLLSAELATAELQPGETLRAEIAVSNLEEFPIPEGVLVAEILSGTGLGYPSQFSDEGTVFYEEKVSGINLPPRESRTVEFSYPLPEDLAPGDYSLHLYFSSGRAPVSGIAQIFLAPAPFPFKVSGEGGFPQAKILRTKTVFNGKTGPVGAPAEPGSEITGEVFVENTSQETLHNLEIFVGLCEWDDTSCTEFLTSSTEKIPALPAGETMGVEISLPSPEMPSAYAVRIELREEGERLLSLYRNRIIVLGATAKVRKMELSGYSFSKGGEVSASILLGPSPDHYTNPAFENFELGFSVENLRTRGIAFSETRAIEKISSSMEYLRETFSFRTPEALDYFRACATVVKGAKVYDRLCHTFDAQEFMAEEEPQSMIETEWEYKKDSQALAMQFCASSGGTPTALSGHYMLLSLPEKETVSEGALSGANCLARTAAVSGTSCLLVVDDYLAGRQHKFTIDLSLQQAKKTCAELGGFLCGKNEACPGSLLPASDAEGCCSVKCAARGGNGTPPEENKPDFAFFVIAALAIVILLFLAGTIKRRFSRNE